MTIALEPLPSVSHDAEIERRAVNKVLWRLIPLMCLLYLFNYLDRQNLMFAKAAMKADFPWLDERVYALAVGLFFVGYCVFEVPSNLIMERVGARIWMARIMISWGLISASMMFVKEAWHLYTLRILLGIAEAGFFPGMILYLTYWVPKRQRSRAAAWFLTSTALSGVVGGPMSDLLLQIKTGSMHGWQWLYLLEGLPSVLLGVVIFFVLQDRPHQAHWLTDEEKRALAARLDEEHAGMAHGKHSLLDGLFDPRVLLLCLLYASAIFGFYVVNYWTADLVRSTLAKDTTAPVGTLSAIPFLAAAVAMAVVGVIADRSGKLKTTVAIMAVAGAAGYALAARAHETSLMILALSLAAAGTWSILGPFWAIPSRFLKGTAAAAGIGLINSVGNLLGGYIGSKVMAEVKTQTKSFEIGLWVSGGVVLSGVVLVALVAVLGRGREPQE